MFAAGSAVQLVEPVVRPAHGVPQTRLVLHVHAEVEVVNGKHLLVVADRQRDRESCNCTSFFFLVLRVMSRLVGMHTNITNQSQSNVSHCSCTHAHM